MFERYDAYCCQLDKVLKRLYRQYMGQDRSFQEVVPGGAAMPPHRLAESVAHVLTLQMSRMDLTVQELDEVYLWIRSACMYLYSCPEEDRRMINLVRLAQLDPETRKYLPQDELPEEYRKSFVYVPFLMKKPLEKAIWLLADRPYAEVWTLEERLWPGQSNPN